MSLELIGIPGLPVEPPASAGQTARLRWYAEVASWAPSKHNAQPWRFVLRGGALEVWADRSRALPETDPDRRELIISCGAALHLACVAARAHGYAPTVVLLPQAGTGPLARLVEGGPWDTTPQDRLLLDAVPRRRTDRGPLDADQLPAVVPFLLQQAAEAQGAALRLVSTAGDRATLASLVARADRLLVRRPAVDEELSQWLREPGDSRPDGVPSHQTRGAAASYRAEFVQRDFSTPGSRPAQDRPGKDRPIVAVLCTPRDRPEDWLTVGRALAAVLLQAAVAGAHASYLNQPVEQPAVRAQLREKLLLPGDAQVILRLGVGGEVAAPPRRPVDDLLAVDG